MKTTIDLTYSKRIEMPCFTEEDAKDLSELKKGWSLSYVYNFSEIRDIYLALKHWNETKFDQEAFFSYCQSIDLPFVRTEWNKRRVLEHLNALKNFSLLDSNYRIIRDVFVDAKIGSALSRDDLYVFKQIYFEYFRFKEIFSWFVNPLPENRLEFITSLTEEEIIAKSDPIFTFSDMSRFTDTFIYELKDGVPVYYLHQDNEDLMRFWDVFIKWGTTLGILEKFSLRSLDIITVDHKSIACSYVISQNKIEFNLLDFLNKHLTGNYIYIPSLVLELAMKFRFNMDSIHQIIIEQYNIHKEHLSLERTSEIFIKKREIKKGDRILFPKYQDSYVSHLIVRR